jgi:hypothetical protein
MLLLIIITLINGLNAKVDFESILNGVGKHISSKALDHLLEKVNITSEIDVNELLVLANIVLKEAHSLITTFIIISDRIVILISMASGTILMIGIYFLMLIFKMIKDHPEKHKNS